MTGKCKNCFNKCFLKECACGCGSIITERDNQNRLRRYRSGHLSGENHYNWKGGRKYDHEGYVHVRIRNKKYRREHIVVMERALGRPLTKDEIVHHKNGVRDDNRLENLELTTFIEHGKIHNPPRGHGDLTTRQIEQSITLWNWLTGRNRRNARLPYLK